MRFLTSMEAAGAVPDNNLSTRLRAVAHRGKVEAEWYPSPEEQVKVERQQKVFWTPDEAAAEGCA